ncbi:hypothetical protein ACSBOB_14910 [Mesorhizobium sp. ASY16-5R]|uniref:hypothetical protein n=1 Tax=Mesorhizobium sp. ASY16-5R TaxID=3445772 RepID=UPI003FA130EE
MNSPVDALLVEQKVTRAAYGPAELRLYGETIHADPNAVIDLYKEMPLDGFLAIQARFGIGNYALVDITPHRCRIVTAPGYCGGYVHTGPNGSVAATTLSPILQVLKGDIRMDSFGLGFFLNYASRHSYNQLPFRTVFDKIFRLPPASLVEFEEGKLTRYSSYIMKGRELGPAASFDAAMNEVSGAIAAYCKRRGIKPAIMFSGGVDSLSIYLAMRQKIGTANIRAITVDHNRANGPDRAFAVADKLGIKVDHVKDNYSGSLKTNAILVEMMKKDIVFSRGPSVALLEKNLSGTLVLHGQNMDAISKINMVVLQANLERGYLSADGVKQAKTDAEKVLQYEYFIGNLQFTPQYLNDVEFQKQTLSFFSRLHNGTISDPDPGHRGILRGMISAQAPNLLGKADYPVDQIENLDIEVDTFRNFIGIKDLDPALAIHLVRYYTYAHIGNKRLATLPTPDGSRQLLVASSGPIVTYFVGKPIELSRALRPKKETYAYVQKLAGMPYSKMTTQSRGNFNLRKLDKFAGDALLMGNMERLDPKNSMVIPRIMDEPTRAYVEYMYRDVYQTARPDDPNVSLLSQSRARQLLNLEQLLVGALEGVAHRRQEQPTVVAAQPDRGLPPPVMFP